MIDVNNGLWLLPTRGRVHTNLPKFLAAAVKAGMTTPGLILVAEDDCAANEAAYRALALPPGWAIWVTPGGLNTTAAKTEEALKQHCANRDWVGWLGDDLSPETENWDTKIIEQLNGWNVVSTADGATAPKKMTGAIAYSGDLLRTVGYMFLPGSHHFYVDDAWEEMGRLSNCWKVDMTIMVRHNNAHWTGDKDATSRMTSAYWANDEKVYQRWRNEDCIPAVNRIMKLMQDKGVNVGQPDLKGIRVLIGTPSGERKYEGLYVQALFNTLNMLKQYGAEAQWGEMPYCSDVALARNKMFGMFLRSDYTHLLWIDDDMGWNAMDVLRLIHAGKDFAAVAGPRKVSPPSFAVNVSDAHGNPTPLTMDSATGFFHATGVGMAFTLLTHACAERMASAYEDLRFTAADGREEHAVFMPLVHNKRWMSEDFAFCHRWKAIGGEIYVCPDISLQHVGANVWSGDWLSMLEAKQKAERAAA